MKRNYFGIWGTVDKAMLWAKENPGKTSGILIPEGYYAIVFSPHAPNGKEPSMIIIDEIPVKY